MRKNLSFAAVVCLAALSAIAWMRPRQVVPASMSSVTIDDVLRAVRADLQNSRTDIMAKNLTLTTAQAARFWPLFEAYQKEQNVVMDEQLKDIQRFIENFDRLDDAAALALINAHLDRDVRMASLRRQWLQRFQDAVGAKTAVRAMQIDRRLSLAQQLKITTKIPLTE